jgi:ABC-2 type transport system permease protein
MNKILTIAWREYQAMVATRAFLIALLLMPVLMLGGAWLPAMLRGLETPELRKIAVLDSTSLLFNRFDEAVKQRNRQLQSKQTRKTDKTPGLAAPADAGKSTRSESDALISTVRSQQKADSRGEELGLQDIHLYELEEIPAEDFGDEQRLALSERIRRGELYAFIEVPTDVLEPRPFSPENLKRPTPDLVQLPAMKWVAEDAALSDARRWSEAAMNQLIRSQRLSSSVSPIVLPTVLLELERRSPMEGGGLYARDESGRIVSESKPDEITSLLLPMIIMMLMFMVIMMSAQPMLESVLEEKTLRIAEVLLGAASARELMAGKLLGNVGGSLTVFIVYGSGGTFMALQQGYADRIPLHIIPWFVIYQILAVLLYSSVFMAIAASVTQLREAQTLLLPVWMVVMLPMFVWFNVVREPNSALATSISMFPPATPMVMTLRMATGATIPLWQNLLSLVLTIGCTYFGVIGAARIYRQGILRQGKPPRILEMLTWIFSQRHRTPQSQTEPGP